jgi:hypothetical protein
MILTKRQVFNGYHSTWPDFEADDACCKASNDVIYPIALRILANKSREYADYTVITSDALGDEAKAPSDKEHIDSAQQPKSDMSLPLMIGFDCIVVHENLKLNRNVTVCQLMQTCVVIFAFVLYQLRRKVPCLGSKNRISSVLSDHDRTECCTDGL